jgi:hypothetical protein
MTLPAFHVRHQNAAEQSPHYKEWFFEVVGCHRYIARLCVYTHTPALGFSLECNGSELPLQISFVLGRRTISFSFFGTDYSIY